MPGLINPAGMVVSYDDFVFGVTLEPPQISSSPVYDSAGRVVVGVRYSIRLAAMIQPAGGGTTTDAEMLMIRQRLSRVACPLRVMGTGFGTGDLIVNVQGQRIYDMEWGPKPKVISMRQTGDKMAWHIDWQVDTVIPEECPEESVSGRPFEWCYSVRWDVDQHGLTRRTVTGHVRIPMTRRFPTQKVVTDSADRLREAVKNLQLVPGFRRIVGPSELSEDRRTLRFTVIDEQLESPYSPPPGVTLVDASHEISNAKARNFSQFISTISAQYWMDRRTPKIQAYFHFLDMLNERRAVSKRAGQTLISLSLSIREDIYRMTTAFVYRYTNTVNINPGMNGIRELTNFIRDIVLTTGLYRKPPNSDWNIWGASMINSGVFQARGQAGLVFDPKDDLLIDVCNKGDMLKMNPKISAAIPPLILQRILPNDELPPPHNSWLSWQGRWRILPQEEVAVLKLLPAEEVRWQPSEERVLSTKPFEPDWKPKPTPPHTIQFRAEPTFYLEFEGTAVRAGWGIRPPVVTEAGSQKLAPLNRATRDFFQCEVNSNLIVPIAKASWRQTYMFINTPKAFPIPPSPLSGGVAQQATSTMDGYFISTR